MPAVLFDLDPTRTPLTVPSRPAGEDVQPLPPGAHEAAARPVPAPHVRAGDLIVASFTTHPASPAHLPADWTPAPYRADPAPWDPNCWCAECHNVRTFLGPPPAAGRIVMTRRAWGGPCDVWDGNDYALIIPANLLLPATT